MLIMKCTSCLKPTRPDSVWCIWWLFCYFAFNQPKISPVIDPIINKPRIDSLSIHCRFTDQQSNPDSQFKLTYKLHSSSIRHGIIIFHTIIAIETKTGYRRQWERNPSVSYSVSGIYECKCKSHDRFIVVDRIEVWSHITLSSLKLVR